MEGSTNAKRVTPFASENGFQFAHGFVDGEAAGDFYDSIVGRGERPVVASGWAGEVFESIRDRSPLRTQWPLRDSGSGPVTNNKGVSPPILDGNSSTRTVYGGVPQQSLHSKRLGRRVVTTNELQSPHGLGPVRGDPGLSTPRTTNFPWISKQEVTNQRAQGRFPGEEYSDNSIVRRMGVIACKTGRKTQGR